MTIAQDMDTALTVIARVRAELAMYPSWAVHAHRLGACIAALEDCMDRTRMIERGPVPAHWLPQPGEAAGVVSLAEARERRQHGREVRL